MIHPHIFLNKTYKIQLKLAMSSIFSFVCCHFLDNFGSDTPHGSLNHILLLFDKWVIVKNKRV